MRAKSFIYVSTDFTKDSLFPPRDGDLVKLEVEGRTVQITKGDTSS